jgi:hypothetical protein
MLTYLNLDETAQVLIHQSCYLRLKQLLQPNSNSNTSNKNNNNNQENQAPVIDTNDRTAEIAAHTFVTEVQSKTPPNTPIHITGKRGRSKTLMEFPSSEIPYRDSSPASKKNRVDLANAVIDQLTNNNNCSNGENRENRVQFLTDLINSDKDNFFPAIRKSNFCSESFKLTEDQTIELRNKLNLTWAQQRLLSSYLHSIKKNIFPPEKSVRMKQNEYKYGFEADYFDFNNDKITYVRATNVQLMLEEQIAELERCECLTDHSNLIPPNEIWLNVLGDKGGHSTKLIVSILNHHKPLSRNQLLLALFEGGSEDYGLVKSIFGPIIDQIYEFAKVGYQNNSIRVFIGGDMKWMWMLHGLSQCGKHFCVYCRTKEASEIHPLRTYPHHIEQLSLWRGAGSPPNKAKEFYNCINEPIIGAAAYCRTAPMPLHTFLGMGELVLSIMRDECLELDRALAVGRNIAQNIPTTAEFNTTLDKIHQFEHEISIIEDWLATIYSAIHGNYDAEILDSNLDQLKQRALILEQNKQHLQLDITNHMQQLNSIEGFFLRQFNQFLLKIKVIRKGNFGHSLVGSEVNRLFQIDTIASLTDILRTQAVLVQNNQSLVLGSNSSADNLKLLMEKLSILYQLCTAARKLEEEEITTIESTAQELFNHYTTAYPNRSITPKMHNLIHHFPTIAKEYKTIGLFSEHSIESVHRRFNQYDNIYCTIRDPIKQLLYCIQQHTLTIDARIIAKNRLIR